MIAFMLILSILTIVAKGSCSVLCIHGTCNGATCNCNPDYTGNDCSIWQTTIEIGVPQTNQLLNTQQWHFYVISPSPPPNVGFRTSVTQTSTGGDADLYIQKNSLPGRGSYIAKDVSGNKQFFLDITSIQQNATNTWYLGLYAFSRVTYDISVTSLTNCPDNCSGHGDCVSGRCQCHGEWSGLNCAVGYQTLTTTGTPVSGQVTLNSWSIFAMDIDASKQHSDVLITLTQAHANEDCDVYVRFNALPTRVDYDFRNISTATVSLLSVPDVQVGRYFVGVVSFQPTSFTIQASLTAASGSTCSSNCSGSMHGACNNGACQCQPCFQGDYCETRVCGLQVNTVMSGTLEPNAWNFYSFEAQSDQAMVVQMVENPGSVDCDLYVKKDSKPNQLVFDYSDVSLGAGTSSVSITAPMGVYWIGVFAFQNCSYQLHIEEGTSTDCAHNCSGHGTCIGGICSCNAPWTGDECQVQEGSLVNGVAVNGSVALNQWQYYNFTSTSYLLSIQLIEQDTTGFVWLFLSTEAPPTVAVYDQVDLNFNSRHHSLEVVRNTTQAQIFFIGVYGSPISTTNTGRSYTLVAWQPPNA